MKAFLIGIGCMIVSLAICTLLFMRGREPRHLTASVPATPCPASLPDGRFFSDGQDHSDVRSQLTAEDIDPSKGNALLNLTERHPPSWLHDTLIEIIDDPRQSVRWRTYAIQHFGWLFSTTRNVDIIDHLNGWCASPEPLIRATSGYQLALIANDNSIAKQLIPSKIKMMIIDADPEVVIAAIRMAILTNDSYLHATTCSLCVSSSSLSVRLAAIESLGCIGTKADMPVLDLAHETVKDNSVLLDAIRIAQYRILQRASPQEN